MSRATTKPLPANLPPLPKPPAGFSGWEYVGTNWGGYAEFYAYQFGSGWFINSGHALRCSGHYAVAVKRPAKASAAPKTKKRTCKCSMVTRSLGDGCDVCNPELAAEIAADNEHFTASTKAAIKAFLPKKPERKAGRVVAVLEKRSADSRKGYYVDAYRFVLPADAASVERMVEQVARKLDETRLLPYRVRARIALAAIGIAAAGKGERK